MVYCALAPMGVSKIHTSLKPSFVIDALGPPWLHP